MKPHVRTLIRSFAAALLVLAPHVAVAQVSSRFSAQTFTLPAVGEEVSVTYDSSPNGSLLENFRATVRGELMMVSNGHLVVRSRSGAVVVPLTSIRSIRRRVGTRPASAPAMALGSAAGFAAGFLLGAATYSDGGSGTSSASNNGRAVGVLLGAPAGALIAWLASRSRPIYEDLGIDAMPVVSVSPTGGVRLSVTLATP